MTAPAGAEKPTILTKALYGSGTVAFGVKDQGFNALLMLYYNQVIGLPAEWVGAAIMIAMVVDALVDPALGQISDDCRTPWGRRHPFMYAAALPIAISYLFLWSPPADWSAEAQFYYLVATAIVVRISISLYEIPSTALLAEFTTDYDERTALVAWRYFFGVLGGLVMTILAFQYFFKPTAEYPVGQLNPAGYTLYAWVAAGVMFVSVLVSSLGTHRRIASLTQPPPARRRRLGETMRGMIAVLTHRSYVPVLLFALFSSVSSGLYLALSVYFFTYFWGLGADQIALVTLTAIGGVFLAFFIALPLSARYGKRPAAMTMFSLSLVVNTTPLALRMLGLFPENGDPALLPLLMAQQALVVMCAISASILAVSMIADVTEQIQIGTGERSEGLLFSVATMVNKAISGMGVFLSGLLLGAVGFPDAAVPGAVPTPVLNALAGGYMIVAVPLIAISILCLAFYPITRSDHLEAVRRLGERAA